jgi:5-methyltetrahydrofolate--homocysteine methyltransferase
MAFDEQGQATETDHKVRICPRVFRLADRQVGFPPQDIIFDPNILTVATGIDEHNDYAVYFLEATRQIKQVCPGAKVSGGVSNVSFSFRGNDMVREAIHAAFLYHAIRAGLGHGHRQRGPVGGLRGDSADLLERVEDVLFNRRPDATERLVDFAERFKSHGKREQKEDLAWRDAPLAQRVTHA